MNPLVSVITPCYNGAGKLQLFLESMLNQTYDNVEFIIVNDGSTDDTEKIILNYKKQFEKKGYKYIYLKQKNAGQDVALNNGLKYFTGDYLMWPDADDILAASNIEEKVIYLEKNKKCGLVYCNTDIVESENLNKVVKRWNKKLYIDKLKNFEDILLGNIIFAGGAWMLRSAYFRKINPEREIIITGQGQNWQMLLPMAFNYDIGKINKFLFTYVIYGNSHSNKKRTYVEILKRLENMELGLMNILKKINMNGDLFHKYIKIVEREYANKKLDLSINYKDNIEAKKMYYNCIDKHIKIYKKIKLKYYLKLIGIYKLLKKLKNI